MSVESQVTQLTRQLEEFTENVRKEYGATKEKIQKADGRLDEMTDRLAKAAEQLAKMDEVTATVMELQKAQQEFQRQARVVPEFDTQVLKSPESFTAKECKSLVEHFVHSETKDADVSRLQELHDSLMFIKAYMEPKGSSWSMDQMLEQGGFGTYHWSRSKSPTVKRMWNEYRTLWSKFATDDFMSKAFDTTEGANWIPDILSSQLMRYLEVNGAVIPLFRSFPMPGPVFRVPITTSVDQAVYEVEGTTGTTTVTHPTQLYSSTPISRVSFDVVKLRASKEVFTDFVEDSIVPMIPFMQQDMGDAIRRAIEDAMINGETTSSGLDVDNITSTHARRLWDGFRTIANDNSSTVSATSSTNLNTADLWGVKKKMARYGLVPSQVAFICGIRSYHELLALSTLETVQNVGAQATLLSGGLTQITGSKVVVSEYVREDLNTSGLYDSSTTNNTIIIAVHTPSWWLGNWRGITLERDRVAASDSDFIYARWRGDFQKMRASTEKTEAVIVDVVAA